MFVDLMKGGLKHGEGGVEILGAEYSIGASHVYTSLVRRELMTLTHLKLLRLDRSD